MNKKDIISKIINQANSLNKKIKKFKDEGIDDHNNFVTAMFNDKQMKYNKSGSMTKSKKFYEGQNILQLKRTLTTLTKINNHEIFGTIKKFKDYSTDQFYTLQHTVRELLLKKGYNSASVEEVVNNKAFYTSLLLAFKESSKSYESDQVVEKTYLKYSNGTLTDEEIKKATSDIEHSVIRNQQLQNHIREYEEFLEYKRGKR